MRLIKIPVHRQYVKTSYLQYFTMLIQIATDMETFWLRVHFTRPITDLTLVFHESAGAYRCAQATGHEY